MFILRRIEEIKSRDSVGVLTSILFPDSNSSICSAITRQSWDQDETDSYLVIGPF
jgi:hypothetical protein